ncbi:MAG: hypothetical protein D6732_25155, partial [Methanobacteriota archaeon]
MSPSQQCNECMLNRQCLYTQIFETLMFRPAPRFLKGLTTAPKPFILYCSDTREGLPEGSHLEFEITLLGKAIQHFPFLIFAVHEMARGGLGKERFPFRLQKVEFQNTEGNYEPLYLGESQKLIKEPQLLFTPSVPNAHPCHRLQLNFTSPVRMKFDRELGMEFTFRQLVFKMLRRVLELAYFYVPDADIEWEFHHLLVA